MDMIDRREPGRSLSKIIARFLAGNGAIGPTMLLFRGGGRDRNVGSPALGPEAGQTEDRPPSGRNIGVTLGGTPVRVMKKPGLIAIGIGAGLLAELVALNRVYAGANLFHGGHPNPIAALILPGAGIVDQLSDGVPVGLPVVLFVVSLVQFPVYGALAARDYANRAFSRVTAAALALHLAASLVASYGQLLDRRWQTAQAAYGACIRSNATADRLTVASVQIVAQVKSIAQTRESIQRLRSEKADGMIRRPDPEPGLLRNLASESGDLERQWDEYRRAGGTARSPEEVTVVPNPCGPLPPRPYIF
jgi:hypothetical protein